MWIMVFCNFNSFWCNKKRIRRHRKIKTNSNHCSRVSSRRSRRRRCKQRTPISTVSNNHPCPDLQSRVSNRRSKPRGHRWHPESKKATTRLADAKPYQEQKGTPIRSRLTWIRLWSSEVARSMATLSPKTFRSRLSETTQKIIKIKRERALGRKLSEIWEARLPRLARAPENTQPAQVPEAGSSSGPITSTSAAESMMITPNLQSTTGGNFQVRERGKLSRKANTAQLCPCRRQRAITSPVTHEKREHRESSRKRSTRRALSSKCWRRRTRWRPRIIYPRTKRRANL